MQYFLGQNSSRLLKNEITWNEIFEKNCFDFLYIPHGLGLFIIPLSAAVGRRFAWPYLTRCNILSLSIPKIDELLVICLTDLFA